MHRAISTKPILTYSYSPLSPSAVLARARGVGVFPLSLFPSPPPLIGRQPPHRRSQSARPSVSRGRFSAHLSRCSSRRQIRTDIVVCLANETNNDSGTTPVIIFYHCWLTPLGVRSTTERRERELLCHRFQAEIQIRLRTSELTLLLSPDQARGDVVELQGCDGGGGDAGNISPGVRRELLIFSEVRVRCRCYSLSSKIP